MYLCMYYVVPVPCICMYSCTRTAKFLPATLSELQANFRSQTGKCQNGLSIQ